MPLPIVGRELRIAARRRRTYWLRSGAALAVLLVWLVLLLSGRRLAGPQLSQHLFIAFGVLALSFCLLAGLFLTADCLSEEKREGTLGLLFLTDLRGYDVVMGKLAATSMHAGYGLLAVFPVLGLPILLGGVGMAEFWRVALVLLATLLLSLGLGMLASALCHEARQAMAGTLFGLLSFAGLLPVMWWTQVVFRAPKWNALLWPSPVFTFITALDNTYRTRMGAHDFWASLGMVASLGLLCLVIAAVLLPRVWRDDDNRSEKRGNVNRNRNTNPRSRKVQGRKRLPLEEDAFGWLVSRAPLPQGPALLIWLLFGLWCCFLIVSIATPRHKEAFVICLFAGYAMHQLFKYTLALDGTRQLSEDARTGALELLLVSPLADAQIVAGHQRALATRFRTLKWLMLLVNTGLCAAVLIFHDELSMSASDQAIFLELFAGGALLLWLDSRTLSLLSISMALRARRHNRAILATLGRVMAVPWTAVFLVVFIISAGGVSEQAAMAIFAVWFGVGMLTDLIVLALAHEDMSQGVRAFVLEKRPWRPETWTRSSLATVVVETLDGIAAPGPDRLKRGPRAGIG